MVPKKKVTKKVEAEPRRVRVWCTNCRGGDGYFDDVKDVVEEFKNHDACGCDNPTYAEMA